MEARELMVGNFVQTPQNGDIFKITSSNLHFSNNYRGVELTEEWLYKFGFIDDFSKDTRVRKIGYRNEGFWITSDFKLITSDQNSVKMEYVHQLQNLYFALTGKELTLK